MNYKCPIKNSVSSFIRLIRLFLVKKVLILSILFFNINILGHFELNLSFFQTEVLAAEGKELSEKSDLNSNSNSNELTCSSDTFNFEDHLININLLWESSNPRGTNPTMMELMGIYASRLLRTIAEKRLFTFISYCQNENEKYKVTVTLDNTINFDVNFKGVSSIDMSLLLLNRIFEKIIEKRKIKLDRKKMHMQDFEILIDKAIKLHKLQIGYDNGYVLPSFQKVLDEYNDLYIKFKNSKKSSGVFIALVSRYFFFKRHSIFLGDSYFKTRFKINEKLVWKTYLKGVKLNPGPVLKDLIINYQTLYTYKK